MAKGQNQRKTSYYIIPQDQVIKKKSGPVVAILSFNFCIPLRSPASLGFLCNFDKVTAAFLCLIRK